jgi:uncharacterized membrane protein
MVTSPLIQGCVLRLSRQVCIYRVIRMMVFVVVTGILVPLALGLLGGIPISTGFFLISTTLGLQAAAGIVGIGLGIHPVLILLITTSIAIGCMYGIYEICDLFARSSPRISSWLQKIENRTKKGKYISQYGPLMLIPIIWIPGISLFGSPVIGWLFHWNRWLSILCMSIGWMIAISVVMVSSMDFIQIFW